MEGPEEGRHQLQAAHVAEHLGDDRPVLSAGPIDCRDFRAEGVGDTETTPFARHWQGCHYSGRRPRHASHAENSAAAGHARASTSRQDDAGPYPRGTRRCIQPGATRDRRVSCLQPATSGFRGRQRSFSEGGGCCRGAPPRRQGARPRPRRGRAAGTRVPGPPHVDRWRRRRLARRRLRRSTAQSAEEIPRVCCSCRLVVVLDRYDTAATSHYRGRVDIHGWTNGATADAA